MKKLLLSATFLLAFFLGNNASAQHYQPFRKGLTYHFISQDSIYSMRIDSAKAVANDSVFVFNRTAKKGTNPTPVPPGCSIQGGKYYIQQNNQFGHKMRKSANGDFIFETQQGQNYLLKTKAAVGQSWTFNATQNITATLFARQVENVLTPSDSVLVFNLSNGAQIKLSKNYGFLTTPNFISYADPYFIAKTLQFYAIPEKGLGHTISNTFQLYDLQPGDKFSYFRYTNTGGFFGSPNCTEEWNNLLVLSRHFSSSGDTLYIEIERDRLYKAYGQAGAPAPFCSIPATTFHAPLVTETLVITAQNLPQTNLLTNSFYAPPGSNAWGGAVSKGIIRTSQFNQREQVILDHTPYDSCSQSFNYLLDNAHITKYAVGLGKVYDAQFPMGGSDVEVLEAYVKNNGTETFGRWQSIAQIMATKKELDAKPLVKAYPNPFTSELTLTFGETSGNMQLTIMNALGQTVWKKETTATANSEVKVKLPELAKGLYLLQASQNGRIYTSRLVKE